MDYSLLLEILHKECLYPYRTKLEKDSSTLFLKEMTEAKKELSEGLSEEKIKQIDNLLLHHLNYMDYINWRVNKKLLEYCVLIGMQLQKGFEEIDE